MANLKTFSNESSVTSITYKTIDAHFNACYPELSLRWQQLLIRAIVYNDLESYPNFTRMWSAKKKTQSNFLELKRGIQTLKHLQQCEYLEKNKKEQMEWLIRRSLEAQLSFLELQQLRKLAKDQQSNRYEILVLQNSFALKVKELHQAFCEHRFSQDFSPARDPLLYQFFKSREKNKFDFAKHIGRSQIFSDVISSFSYTLIVFRTIPTIILTHTYKTIFFLIPVLSSFIAAAPILMGAVHSYLAQKNWKKKTFNTTAALFVVAGIATALTFPMTVAAISGTFIGIGVLKDNIKPVYDLYRALKIKKQEQILNTNKLSKITESDPNNYVLDKCDKHFLLHKLETYCITQPNIDLNAIAAIRFLLSQPQVTLTDVMQHDFLISALGVKDIATLHKVVELATFHHQQRLNAEIKALKSSKMKKIILAANGGLTIVGAVCFGIPTPITMLVGALCLCSAAFINVVVKYELITKIKNWVENTFTPDAMAPASKNFSANSSGITQVYRKLLTDKPTVVQNAPLANDIDQPLEPASWTVAQVYEQPPIQLCKP